MIYDSSLDALAGRVLDGARISADEALRLHRALPLNELGLLADARRRQKKANRAAA